VTESLPDGARRCFSTDGHYLESVACRRAMHADCRLAAECMCRCHSATDNPTPERYESAA
jgi:hypothetical protein